MGFGNFLKGVVAQVNPFDNGRTYGSYNPRKKRQDEQGYRAPSVRVVQPGQNIQTPDEPPELKAQRPENLFAGLNQNLALPSALKTATSVNPKLDLTPLVKPQPGTVVRPGQPAAPTPQRITRNGQSGTLVNGHFVPDAPKPQDNGFWQKVGRGFKTAGETAVGTVANVPEVGLAATRAGTGLVEGITQLPHVVTAATATGTEKLAHKFNNPITRQVNRGFQDMNTGVKDVTEVVDKPFDAINRNLDRAAAGYERDVPMAAGGAKVYRNTQIPINVLAALLTLGGSSAAEAGQAGKVGQVTRFLDRPLTSNPENVVARTGRAVSNRTTPVVNAVNRPFSSTKDAVMRLITGRSPYTNPIREATDAGEVGNLLSDAQLQDLTTTQVPVGTGIDVNAPTSTPVNVPVRVAPRPTGPPIRELAGDTPGAVRMPTADEVAAQRARNTFDNQASGRPDQRIEGVSTKSEDVFTTAKRDEFQAVLDNRVKAGQITEEEHKALTDELQKLQVADKPVPKGNPITVKSVDSIPVQNKITVPTDLPETPGTVRSTTSTAPANTEAAVVAAQTPARLPAEVQAVLDNPKQFNKRQVAAARNQAKLAKAKAKADEATAAAMERSLSAKPTSDKGFVDTGEYAKGSNGNAYQKVHRATEDQQAWHDIANTSTGEVLSQAEQEMLQNGARSEQTVRNLKAKLADPNIPKNTPEGKALIQEYKDALTRYAQGLALADRTVRRNGTAEQIANKFINKLIAYSDDGRKLTDSHIEQVNAAENAFTEARDTANAAGERFKATGSQSDFEAWKTAQQAAEKADRQAKITEFIISKDVLKGNKSLEASQAIQDAEKEAGVYSMDSIDANMLSGTGTMVRNFVNTLFPRMENKMFGRITTRAVKPIATVGGSSGRGARIGSAIGKDMYKADVAARKEAGVGRIRRTVTAGNTIGERNIQATAYSKGFDHYKQILKGEGYTGKELSNRAEFMARNDPHGRVAKYEKDALEANALSSLTHSKKIENWLADAVQKGLANAGTGAKGQTAGRFVAKATTRVAVGFPTVIAKSLLEGLKRATLGIPEAGWSSYKFARTGNKEIYAAELAKSMQHAGSGAGMIILGRELAKHGVISGAYPSDKAERERWQAEGRQENSINIGGQWFNIPGYLGGFALPLMLGATTAGGNIKDEASLKNAWSTVLAASPVDNIKSTLDIMTGNSSEAKIKNAATSLARAATPAGAFLAELAKLTDSTQNDTTTKDTLHNILDSIAGGIPGLNNKVNKIAKTDAFGNELHNPNRVATVLGAQGSDQNKGQQDVKDAQTGANDSVSQLKDAGVLDNKTLMGLVDKKLAAKISSGQSLTPEEVTQVQKSVTKGVSATDDNNWRENGDYDTDKAALSAKLQMLDADPTAKKSEKEMIKAQITRDDLLKSNNIPYDALKLYQSTNLTDWRAMGDPENDNYDPDTYQKLWDIDQMFTKAGVSYKEGDMKKNKFSAKGKKEGSGSRSRASELSSEFGTLKAGNFAPQLQQYQSLDQASGSVPIIRVVRPNIVHKIGSSG